MIKRVWLILLLMFVAACSGSNMPSEAEIENAFKVGLPSLWKLNKLKVTAQEDAGTKTAPEVRSRFTASVELAVETYMVTDVIGDMPVLDRVRRPGDLKTDLHGIALSTRKGEGWLTTFDLENTANIGGLENVRSHWNRYVLKGSPEEVELRRKAGK